MDHLIIVALMGLGLVIGATFADIDLAPPLPIRHRSAWTHGPLIPIGMSWLIGLHPLMFWFSLGFLPAFCLHLLKDMFPKGWHGGALIKLFPIPFTLPALLSFIYLGLGVYWAGRMFVDLFLSLNLI